MMADEAVSLLSAGCQGFLYWEWAGLAVLSDRSLAADKDVVARVSGCVRGTDIGTRTGVIRYVS